MIDLDEINAEIARLEAGKTTYSAVEKLGLLYIVRDNLGGNRMEKGYSYASAPKSEFVQLAENAPKDGLLMVLDEHFEAIRALYPKEYDAVLRKIRDL